MSIEDTFPGYEHEDRGEAISDMEIDSFTEMVVWRAANSCYGNDFREIAEAGEDTDKELPDGAIYSPNGEEAVILGFNAYCDISPRDETQLSHQALVGFHTLRLDLSQELTDREQDGGAIWEVWEYEFDSQHNDHTIYHFFDFLTKEGDVVNKISKRTTALIRSLGNTTQPITRQACLDVYNILLALDIPEEDMAYNEWQQEFASDPADQP